MKSRILRGNLFFIIIPQELDAQQNGAGKMKEQVEYIHGPDQFAIYQHDQFFKHMRHRAERRQQHKNCNKYQNRIGYAVK